VDAVDVVTAADITDEDAVAAGYPDAAALVADLRGSPEQPLYRVRFHAGAGPDPRAELAASDSLSPRDLAALERRLARLDSRGPWTLAVLLAIAARPGVRAGDLAAALGRDRASFKLDVRKLKNLGLTISLPVGYRLSPRGTAYLAARQSAADGGVGEHSRAAWATVRGHHEQPKPAGGTGGQDQQHAGPAAVQGDLAGAERPGRAGVEPVGGEAGVEPAGRAERSVVGHRQDVANRGAQVARRHGQPG
jgi:hypothetical protein